jgi:hypothetical protein
MIMKNKIHVPGVLTGVILIVFGCRTGKEQVANIYPKNLVLVLCDLTTSIDSLQTIDKVINNADKVLASLPPNTTYTLSPLGQTPDRAIYEGTTEADLPADEILTANREKYDECLKKLYAEYGRRHDRATCITDALQASTATIKALQEKHIYDKITLIILSDMLEVCSVNGTSLNFENKIFDPVAANKVLKDWPDSRRCFTDMDGVEIYVVFNTSKLVSYPKLSDFWGEMFAKAGYKRKVFFVTDFRSEYYK